MGLFLLSPAVMINGAWWCQCDIIYSTFILLAFYACLRKKSSLCLLFTGIAVSFKLQAVFFLPFLVILWLRDEGIRLRDFLLIPASYVVLSIPAWLMGRSFTELMTVYFDQSSYYPWGTLEYPNAWAFLGEIMPDERHMKELAGGGILFTFAILGILAYVIYRKKIRIDQEMAVTLALLTIALTVYCLPHMHDRYGFLIDIFAILYGLIRPERFFVTIGCFVISILSAMPYLNGIHLFEVQTLAAGMLILILVIVKDFLNRAFSRQGDLR